MVIKKIIKTPTDEDFRRHVKDLIDSAKNEIFVIAGEVGSYRSIDLKMAATKASARGVKIHVYANRPTQEVLNGLLARGCEVFVGEETPKDHYLVVDSNSWILSKGRLPREKGARRGEVHIGEPKGAKKAIDYFRRLASKGEKKTKIDWRKDPLKVALANPPDWGTATDSSRIKEAPF